MNVKKWAGYAILVFIIWYIFTSPSAAAGTFHTIMGALEGAASSAATFVSGVAG